MHLPDLQYRLLIYINYKLFITVIIIIIVNYNKLDYY